MASAVEAEAPDCFQTSHDEVQIGKGLQIPYATCGLA
jgi:hypothetical protein